MFLLLCDLYLLDCFRCCLLLFKLVFGCFKPERLWLIWKLFETTLGCLRLDDCGLHDLLANFVWLFGQLDGFAFALYICNSLIVYHCISYVITLFG